MSIPKILHYCWFGTNPVPESTKRYIESWKKYCPDYEIKFWNESNFDINYNDYTRQAYEAGKFAFVADVARLYVVSEFGGIYLDTDVELIKPLDELLTEQAFFPLELPNRVSTGLGFGAIAHHPLVIKNLKAYDNRQFVKPNGKNDLTSCVTITSEILKSELPCLTPEGHKLLVFDNRIANYSVTILPTEYMAPFNLETRKLNVTPNTVSIHHYDATWQDKPVKFLTLKIKLRRLLGSKFYDKIKALIK